MKKVAVVYHSGYGHTAVIAKHVLQGASSVEGVKAELFPVEDVTEDVTKLNEFDAIIFGAPTYMGSVSAQFKTFMDASSKVWYGQEWKDKLAAGFTNSLSMSGDKFNSLMQLVTFSAQQGMIWVGQAEPNESIFGKGPSGNPEAVNRIGSHLGAMAQSDNVSAEESPLSGDLKTAELLGVRVAKVALRFNA